MTDTAKPEREFDLTSEPWIPLLAPTGQIREVGLREALQSADRYAAIAGDNPLQTIALMRLLLAVLHRAVPVASVDEAIERAGRAWSADPAIDYLDAHRDAFWLFHPERPFLQAPWLADHPKVRSYHVAKITTDWTSGNEKTLLDHHHEGDGANIGYALAARTLVAHQQFALGGLAKVFLTSAVGAPAVGFASLWAVGRTLAESLLLAQVPTTRSASTDLPAWERPIPVEADIHVEQPPPPGPVTRYAWHARTVLLERDAIGSVGSVRWAEGPHWARDPNALDPMQAVRQGKDGAVSLQLSEAKSFWRDYQALLGSGVGHASATVQHAADVLRALRRGREMRIHVAGLLPDKAKIILWRNEQSPLPADLLADPACAVAVREAIATAEGCGIRLRNALRDLSKAFLRPLGGSPAEAADLARSLPGESIYWASLEPAFWHAITLMADPSGVDTALQGWQKSIEQSLRSAWRASGQTLGTSARALSAIAQADRGIAVAIRESRGLVEKLGEAR